MSARVGAVPVFNLEHLLHDLANSGDGIELAALDGLEELPEPGVVTDGVLQMRLRARRGEGPISRLPARLAQGFEQRRKHLRRRARDLARVEISRVAAQVTH